MRALRDIRWLFLLGVAAGANLIAMAATSVSFAVVLAVTAVRYPGPLTQERFFELAGEISFRMGWLGALWGTVFTVLAAAWVGRRVQVRPVLHGTLAGLLAGGLGVLVGFFFGGQLVGGLPLADLLVATAPYGALGAAAAWISRRTVRDPTRLLEAGRALSTALAPDAVLEALGRVVPERAALTLWRVAMVHPHAGTPHELALEAAHPSRPQPASAELTADAVPSLRRLEPGTPLTLRVNRLPEAERRAWQRLGVGWAWLVWLPTPEMPGEHNRKGGYVLMVSTAEARGLGRGVLQDVSVLVSQVALTLEKIHLLEQARHVAVLEERQRLAREIHDTLAQGFTSIVMHLEAAEGALPGDLATVQRHLNQARDMARTSLEEARRLVWALRPKPLEQAPLPEALARVVERWSRESGIPADVTVTGTPAPLRPEAEVTLLRAAQEALTNVRKHARASRVTVTLSYMDDLVVLDVQDDGVGFDPAAEPPASSEPPGGLGGGFGLRAMRERVTRLGGQLLIESAPGEGTTVVVEVPVQSENYKS